QAAFAPQQASVTAGESVTFDSSGSTGTIVSYAWQFGDGGTSAEANPTYPYNAPGEYQVTLTVSDGVTQSTATGTVSVGAGLQAAFTPQQANVTAGEGVTFDSSASTGNIVSYAWQFGDGGTSAEANPTYPYNAPGEYQVTLTISDGVTQSTATGTVSVGAGLQAAFFANPEQANVGDTISFDASASTGPISTFQWDFGDGNSSVDPAPLHPYQAPGEYTVTLTLTSVGGQVSQAQQTVSISAVQVVSDPQIAFASDRAGNLQIFVMNADGAAVERITDTGGIAQQPSWSVNNELVYSLDGQLFISRVDDRSARPVSPDGGATVIQGVQPAWSPNGAQIAFVIEQPDGTADIAVVNSDGSGQTQLTTAQGVNRQPTWSPDGSRVAFSTNRDGNFEIYVMNAADGGNPTRLTDDPANDVQPAWSPDGGRIAFAGDRGDNGDREIFVMGADGSNPTRLTNSPGVDAQPTWRRDNSQIVFSSARDNGDREIYVMGADGSNPTRLTEQPGQDVQPFFRP
ncbi:MAG: PKD domain-containing protein, partial [Chloroflexota bacterium]